MRIEIRYRTIIEPKRDEEKQEENCRKSYATTYANIVQNIDKGN